MSTTYKALVIGAAALAAVAVFAILVLFGGGSGERDFDNLRGENLAAALGAAAREGQRPLDYDDVWAALEVTDAAPGDDAAVLLFYSGRTAAAADKVSAARNPDHDGEGWNREHLWPRSRGVGEDGPAATDLHHIRATDVACNAERGARAFDRGGTPIDGCRFRRDGDSVEPRDGIKGDVARMLFYMDVRYDGADGTPDLELVRGAGGEDANTLGDLCRLLAWHTADPLEGSELDRHARIVAQQGNRNPFVDRPDLADKLYGPRCR
ncbi:MAG: endonuclease I family protein [Alphaproteobacteria bacterium]